MFLFESEKLHCFKWENGGVAVVGRMARGVDTNVEY